MTLEANNKESAIKDVAIAVIILIGAIATAVFLPFSFLGSAFVVILVLSLLRAKWGFKESFIALLSSLFVGWWLEASLLLIFLPFLLGGLLFGSFLKKKEAPFKAVLKGIVFLGVSFIFVLFVAGYFSGTPLWDIAWWQDSLNQTYSILKATYIESGIQDVLASQGLSEESFFSSLENILWHIYILIPVSTLITLGLIGLGSYLLATYILNRKEIDTLSFPPFQSWYLSWHWIWLLIFALSFWLIGNHWQIIWAKVVGENLLFGYAFLSLIIGLAIVNHFYVKWSAFIPPFLRVLLLFLIIIQLPLLMILCVLLGAFDPLLDLRKLQKEEKG